MAKQTFKAGKVTLASNDLSYVRDASLTIEEDQEVDTVIGQTWESVTALGRRWRMDVTCDYDPTDTAQAACITAVTSGSTGFSSIQLYVASSAASSFFSGSGVITNANVRKAVGSMDKLVMSFRNQNEALSYTV